MIEARIIGAADTIEAMANYHPYRPAVGISAAMDEINRMKGAGFGPDVVDVSNRAYLSIPAPFQDIIPLKK